MFNDARPLVQPFHNLGVQDTKNVNTVWRERKSCLMTAPPHCKLLIRLN
jgi:hypothetical protein